MNGRAFEFIAAQGTAISTGAALTAVTGDTLKIRPAPQGAYLLNWWYKWQTTAGYITIVSSKLHDRQYGINARTVLQEVSPLMPLGISQPLYSEDELVITASGSATSGDIESLGMYIFYPELAGSNGNYIDHMELERRRIEIFPVEVDITAGTAGGYSGTAAINSLRNSFKPGTEYALLGCSVDGALSVGTLAVTIRGQDTSNLRIGIPVHPTRQEISSGWFLDLAKAYRDKMIPVFNGATKDATYVEVVTDENGGSPKIVLNFVALGPK